MMDLDSTPTLPDAVLVVDDEQYARLSESADTVKLLEDTGTLIVPRQSSPETNETLVIRTRELLRAANLLVPGALLIKSPFDDDRYEPSEHALLSFATAKYHALAHLSGLLGAKRITFDRVSADSNDGRIVAQARGRHPVVAAEVESETIFEQKLAERLGGSVEFEGSTPDLAAAREFLVRRHLSNDQQMRDLVEMRSGQNTLKKYTVSISGTREAAMTIKAALEVAAKTPVPVAGLSARYEQKSSSISNFDIRTEIEF